MTVKSFSNIAQMWKVQQIFTANRQVKNTNICDWTLKGSLKQNVCLYCGPYTSLFAGNQSVAESGGSMSEMSEEDSFTRENPRRVSYMLSCGNVLQVKSMFYLSNTSFVVLLSCTVHCVLWIWCACPIKRSKKRINHQNYYQES
jgi:hypothetical protein